MRVLAFALCLFLAYSKARADEATYSAAEYVAAGLLMVDVGACAANGIALTTGRPNRLNGYFGVVAGVVSLGLVGANYALTDDEELRDSFALVFGAAGTLSTVLGFLVVRSASQAEERTSMISRIRFLPYLSVERDRRSEIGVNAQILF